MPVSITRYVVLLSSPGDAESYCNIAKEVINSINRTHSEPTGIELYTTDWRRDSAADSGDEPQALLNKQIVEGADVVLAVFKEKFGTPTKNYGSGTEEEIRLGLESGKRVMVYFWQPPEGHSPSSSAQPDEIAAFRASLGGSALYKLFASEQEFRSAIKHDFEKLVYELEDTSEASSPSLSVAAIGCDGDLSDSAFETMSDFPMSKLNSKYFDDKVCETYRSVKASPVVEPESKIQTPKPLGAETNFKGGGAKGTALSQDHDSIATVGRSAQSIAQGALNFGTSGLANKLATHALPVSAPLYEGKLAEPVNFSDEDIELVSQQLSQLGIECDASLFYLGSLSRSLLAPAMYWRSEELCGTEEEKEKYKLLSELVSSCRQRFYFYKFIADYRNMGGVALALRNNGKAPAHHARVEIRIPSVMLIKHENAPLPDDYFIGYFLANEDNLDLFAKHLFTPQEEPSYRSYEDSCVITESGQRIGPMHQSRFGALTYESRLLNREDFLVTLDYLYADFSVVVDHAEGETVIAVEFDRVQHGSAYAFPAYLLVKSTLSAPIKYRITADEQESPIAGELVLQENAN